MIRCKVCMLGAFSVGKTSLVRRFVEQLFSERYHTTVGVKIDKKVLAVAGQEVTLLVWDLHGEDEFQAVRESYFRGSSGYVLVADLTRAATVETALALEQRFQAAVPSVPGVLLLNKVDLSNEREVDAQRVTELTAQRTVFETSAKTGAGVEEAFQALTAAMLSD